MGALKGEIAFRDKKKVAKILGRDPGTSKLVEMQMSSHVYVCVCGSILFYSNSAIPRFTILGFLLSVGHVPDSEWTKTLSPRSGSYQRVSPHSV